MAKRYRTFKRVRMTANSARMIVDLLADRTFQSHFAMECVRCGSGPQPADNEYCESCERETDWSQVYECSRRSCAHVSQRTLEIAQLIENGAHISKTKAYIDLPGDQPDLLRLLAERLRSFGKRAGKSKNAFYRLADDAEHHARRGWLHQLAECALDINEEALG